jgi:hydroxymethylglutaryl-CoA reductase
MKVKCIIKLTIFLIRSNLFLLNYLCGFLKIQVKMLKTVNGFSKLNKLEKIDWLVSAFFNNDSKVKQVLKQYWNSNQVLQDLHDDFIENTITNFYLPFGIAPNFIINKKEYTIPMVIEESSVVAAASLVAKFWSTRGGFKAQVISTTKVGQVHFMYEGKKTELQNYFVDKKEQLLKVTDAITKNMRNRGGGILDIELRDKTSDLENYYQLHVTFETADSMGANFINSCLEEIAKEFEKPDIQIVMSILSNYVPECIVRAEVSCKVEELYDENSELFAQKFVQAVQIANAEPHRAVTHNKGIMNGIDAVVIATGNDFRAIEAGAHAFAARSGRYKSLSNASIENGLFKFWIEIPLALGTVGGLTKLHPLSKLSLKLLGDPSAKELMQIVAVAGLAQNFAALRALTTTGIQKGHMKMHLTNIIKQLGASNEEKEFLIDYFEHKTVTHNAVVEAYNKLVGDN